MEASPTSSSEGVGTPGFSTSPSGGGSNNDCSVSGLRSLEEGSTSSSYTKVSSTGGSSFTGSGKGRGAVKLAKGSGVGVGSDIAEAGFADTVSSCWVTGTSKVTTSGVVNAVECQLGLKFLTGPIPWDMAMLTVHVILPPTHVVVPLVGTKWA